MKKGMRYASLTWIDPGDNLPALGEITRITQSRIYWKTIRMYDGTRYDLGSTWYGTPEYFLSHYRPITEDEFTARLQYRQRELTPEELRSNLTRKTWINPQLVSYERCYTTDAEQREARTQAKEGQP